MQHVSRTAVEARLQMLQRGWYMIVEEQSTDGREAAVYTACCAARDRPAMGEPIGRQALGAKMMALLL